MAGMTWGQAIAGGVDRGLDTAMQARRMKIYEGRESREQEEHDTAKKRLEQQQKALDQLSNADLKDEERFKRPDDVDADVWLDMRAKTLAADEATRKAVTEKAIQARYNGLSKFEAAGGDPSVAGQLFDEIAADGKASKVIEDPKTGEIQVIRGERDEKGHFLGDPNNPDFTFKNRDEMREALYKASDPKNLIPHFLKSYLAAEDAAREVDTYRQKKEVDRAHEAQTPSREFEIIREKSIDQYGTEREKEIPVDFDKRTGKARRIEIEGESGDDDYEALKKKALGGGSR